MLLVYRMVIDMSFHQSNSNGNVIFVNVDEVNQTNFLVAGEQINLRRHQLYKSLSSIGRSWQSMSLELDKSMDGRRLGQIQFYIDDVEAFSSQICIVGMKKTLGTNALHHICVDFWEDY